MARKSVNGVITKISGDKTYKVEVSYRRMHKLYKKIVSYKKIYLAHSENQHEVGEKVTLIPLDRRISKRKSFVILEKSNKVEGK